MRIWWVLLIVSAAMGCEHSSERAAPAVSAPADAHRAGAAADAAPAPVADGFPPLQLEKTAALITRADLAAKVDALAAQPRIEASHVGYGGTPSAIWASWDAVRSAATPAELVALLRHESPIVRGYVARYVVASLPDQATQLLPLFGDTASVETLEGDVGGNWTIDELVVSAICYANAPAKEVTALLLTVARAPHAPAVARHALACAAQLHVDGVADVAKSWIADAPSPEAVVSALQTLAALDPTHACASYLDALASTAPLVRRAALDALASCSGDDTIAHVEKLLDDPDRGVARAAAAAWLQLTKDQPGPKLRLDKLEAGGGHSPDSIKSEMQVYTQDVAMCFRRAAPKPGQVIVKWMIDQTGKTLSPAIDTSTVGDATLEKCIVDDAATWTFRGEPGGVAGTAWAMATATFVYQ